MASKFLDAAGLKYAVGKIKKLIATKQDKLTFDSTPTSGSTNPVTSGGIKTALDSKLGTSDNAASATKDASGNVIADTYATKTYVAEAIKTALEAATVTYDGKVTYKG